MIRRLYRGCPTGSRSIAMIAAVAAITLSSTAVASAAEAPRWQLQAVPTPTNIIPNAPRNEVQKLTVDATGGTFGLEVHTRLLAEPGRTSALAYDATATEVQAALEALAQFGEKAGNVTVSGGPGSGTPHEYEITFEGVLGDELVGSMRVETKDLSGGGATIVQTTAGAHAPQLILAATNVGGAATDGTKITVSDSVPPWLTVTEVTGYDMWKSGFGSNRGGGSSMSCEAAPVVSCTYAGSVDTGDQLMIYVTVDAGASAPAGAVNVLTASGGGAPEATLETALPSGSGPAAFGPAPGSVFATASTMQAGAHPSVVTSFWLDTSETEESAGNPKDISFDLPPGLVGSTVGMPRCSMARVIGGGELKGVKTCPSDTMVGVAQVTFGFGNSDEALSYEAPIYDIQPSPGEPAAFAFDAVLLPVRLDTSVLSNGNYAVRVTASDLNESESAIGSTITIWGVPAEHSGPGKNGELTARPPYTFGGPETGETPTPLLTNPQQCGKEMLARMSTDPWTDQGAFKYQEAPMGSVSGCLQVPFSSSFTFLPDTLEAGAPAGYTFDLDVPQQNTAGTLASSSVKHVTLTLPEGVVVNPSAAWGLKACTNAQFYGSNHPSQEPASLEECPREAQIGEVEVESPDLEHPLKGQVFLGSPECDPCTSQDAAEGRMVRLLVQLVGEGEAGIVVKLEGKAKINQVTGQITTEFEETPQVPFTKMKFVLEGGPRAVLANPRKCGTVKTTGDLTPWSSEPGISDSTPYYEFEIDQNCFGPQFNPSLKAGMPNIQAGESGEFTLAFGRSDDDEYLNGITTSMPEGLLGRLKGVELCDNMQAEAGSCGSGSVIGTVEALTGPGADSFLVSGGKVSLTEGYGGAPYGLSIVVPAVAGPYTLGGVTGSGAQADNGEVVVRAQIFVDPHTAQLTVVSANLPSMLDGIPLQLKAVNVRINRPGFMFNPTSCDKSAIGGRLTSTEGMSASISVPFQVTDCARLAFKPAFEAFTSAKASRTDGASLTVKLSQAGGGEANIHRAKVELPKILPSRLSTLQKACTEAQFNANPAGCPTASMVGTAIAHTPILNNPLQGPAYFVSHGGAKFPELIMVLQGEGITIDLAGETFISKAGVTSTTLSSVPDAPVSTFELTLPMGKHSALAANGNLCAQKLVMPTEFTGQNGVQVSQLTPIDVEGCSKTLRFASKFVKGRKVTVKVYVPAAGKIKVSGRGLTSKSKKAKGHETLKFILKQKQAGKLATRLQASFTPNAGKTRKKQNKSAKVSFKR